MPVFYKERYLLLISSIEATWTQKATQQTSSCGDTPWLSFQHVWKNERTKQVLASHAKSSLLVTIKEDKTNLASCTGAYSLYHLMLSTVSLVSPLAYSSMV